MQTQPEERLSLVVRPMVPTDEEFFFSTWLANYFKGSVFGRSLSSPIFHPHHHRQIERVLRRGAIVRVACMPEDHNVIFGYACTEGSTIHYCYVKQSYRRLGVARALLGDLDLNRCTFTHLTTFVERVLLPKWPEATFNPYKFFL